MRLKKQKNIEPTDRAYYRFIRSVNTLRSPIEGSIAEAMSIVKAKTGNLYLNSENELEPYFCIKADSGKAKILFQNGKVPKDWLYAYENELVFVEKREGGEGARYVFNTVFNDWNYERQTINKPKKEAVVMPVKIDEVSKKIGLLTFTGNRLGIEGAGIERFTVFMSSVGRIIARILNERFDSVTKLSRRFDGEALVKDCVNDYSTHGKSFSIMFIDIDNFKHVNDAYGHDRGDRILREVSERIKGTVRIAPRNETKVQITDRVFRWGGEEIVVVLQDTSLEKAKKIAERIRWKIEKDPISDLDITCSIGVANISDIYKSGEVLLSNEYDKKAIGMDLIQLADMAMYKAKRNGKNRVVLAKRIDDSICFREVDKYTVTILENNL